MRQDARQNRDANKGHVRTGGGGPRRIRAALLASATLGLAGAIGGCASGAGDGPTRQKPSMAQMREALPNLPEARKKALQAQRTKDPEKAIRLYREAVGAFPGFSAAWNNLGVLLMDEQEFLEAAEAFAAAADQAPSDPRPMYNLGALWDKQGWPEDALRFYLKALDRDSRYQPALRGVIRMESLLDRADENTMTRLKTALLQESDERWREFLLLQRARAKKRVEELESSMYSTPRRRSNDDDSPSEPAQTPSREEPDAPRQDTPPDPGS